MYIINAYFDRIDVSEEIDVNNASESKECEVCHYSYFFKKAFTSQPNVCNECHDLSMISMNLSNIAILSIKSSDYHCIISGISKSGAINLIQKCWFDWKKQNIIRNKKFIFIYKNR